jgi:anti-sigma factor RsiW
MNCERMEAQWIAYLDGRANPRERREAEQHFAACAACRARLEEYRGVWKLLEEVPAPDPSPWFDAQLRQRVAAEPAPSGLRRLLGWLPQPRLAVATLALVVLGFWVALAPPQPQRTVPPAIAMNEQEEFKMIKNMHVLENYDVLKDLDALNELQGN